MPPMIRMALSKPPTLTLINHSWLEYKMRLRRSPSAALDPRQPRFDQWNADAIALSPSQAVHRPAERTVLAANPARVAELVEQVEHIRIVDFADGRLVPARDPRNLHVAQQLDVGLQRLGQMSLEHLHMVEVQVQEQVVARNLLEDAARLRSVVEEIAVHALRGVGGATLHDAQLPIDRF